MTKEIIELGSKMLTQIAELETHKRIIEDIRKKASEGTVDIEIDMIKLKPEFIWVQSLDSIFKIYLDNVVKKIERIKADLEAL